MATEIIWFLVCVILAAFLYFAEMEEKSVVIWSLVAFLVAEACTEVGVLVGANWLIFQAEMVKFYAISKIHFRLLYWSRYKIC